MSAFAQTQNVPCRIIRKVAYPITQTRADQKVRIALLNICPSNPGMMARPMISMIINGQMVEREYDILQVFKRAGDAKRYAKKHNITDISF